MTDTLAYQKNRAFQRPLDMSHVELLTVVSQYEDVCKFLITEDGVIRSNPEDDAIWFYMANHAMAEIAMALEDFEPLGDYMKHVENYHQMMQIKSLRMFFYLLMISSREARHCHMSKVTKTLRSKYPKAWQAHQQISGNFSPSKFAAGLAGNDITIVEWLEYIEKQYTMSGTYGGSYGGKPWANITRVAKEFCQGKITMEMLLDTAFTLSHNCGPIFNKGMLFNHSGHELIKILDVQRSGQIPQMVAEGVSGHINATMQEYQQQIAKVVPSFSGYVDWFKVEKLGAVGHYSSEKSAQTAKYGAPGTIAVDEKVAKMKAKIAKKVQDKKDADFDATHFEIIPDVFVKKIDREAI